MLDGSIPNNSLIITDPSILPKILTPKRVELMEAITKHHPQSVQELANITKRTKQAVDRELHYLEGFNLIELQKEGRRTIPTVKGRIALIQLPYEEEKKSPSGVRAQKSLG